MSSETILVIDDQPEVAHLVTRLIGVNRPGAEVLSALDGPSGLRAIAERRPDVVILDAKLPGMDGFEVCRRLRADPATADIPVLMISGTFTDPLHRAQGLDVGADGFLCKPFEAAEFSAQLRSLLRLKRQSDQLRRREKDLEDELARRAGVLRESEEKFRTVFEHSPDAIFVEADDGEVLDVNPAACALHGMSRSELVGRSVFDLVPEDQREIVREQFPRWFTGELTEYRGFSRARAGRDVPVEMRASRVCYAGRRAILLHVRDISLREKLLQRFTRLNECLLSLGADSERNIQRFTALAGEELGADFACYSGLDGHDLVSIGRWRLPDEIPDRNPAEGRVCASVLSESVTTVVVLGDLAATPFARTDPAVERLGLRTFAGRAVTWQGRPVGVLCALFRRDAHPSEEDRDFLSIVASALSAEEDRRRADRLARENDDRLRQAQKMEALGRLSGGVAHDFNNLLTAILGYGRMLLADRAGDAALCADLAEIVRAGERGEQLTRQLLTFSRRQPAERIFLDLNAAVTDIQRLLRRTLGEDIELRMVLGENLGAILADAGQIGQIIMNLSVNARAAMPRGGRLTIRTSVVTLDAADGLARPDAAPGRYVLLEVEDTGSGMSPEVREHAFEPFFTTKRTGEGSGFGLAIVYAIVQQSGGFIDLETGAERGTTFRIHFPRLDVPPETPTRASATALPRGQETILVVEDDAPVRHLAARLLASLGYRVLEAADGDEAASLAESADGAVDLLLTDVVMPRTSGGELVARLRSSRPGMRFLYMTGFSRDAAPNPAAGGPAVPVLMKPFTLPQLAMRVREVLDGPPPGAPPGAGG